MFIKFPWIPFLTQLIDSSTTRFSDLPAVWKPWCFGCLHTGLGWGRIQGWILFYVFRGFFFVGFFAENLWMISFVSEIFENCLFFSSLGFHDLGWESLSIITTHVIDGQNLAPVDVRYLSNQNDTDMILSRVYIVYDSMRIQKYEYLYNVMWNIYHMNYNIWLILMMVCAYLHTYPCITTWCACILIWFGTHWRHVRGAIGRLGDPPIPPMVHFD